ncbi:MAG: NAD(P)(+) transhydrogenase (Re/Si-specific) subunit beta [Gemmatimonadales bacterium]|nr:NAD(P)(+) transhydrogenase (Re/Si-specific) subunit beta [Gemmatimonadales bacterium]MBP6571275.1 NAD(P)(+) transhydrogenase (Re/Si-specific) subunit beta [Gemmatimonadales bacterium]MBP7620441.1 NAD(P)(+) transhydrogenase (Re/Si-specific) subunit beta [Gemmatimonadales bacterium]
MRELFTQATYLAASVFFILGLRSLAHPDRARAGMNQAAIGMLLAVLGTVFVQEIVTYEWIVAGLIIGTVIGVPLGTKVQMTAMPQVVAISHGFGALAATLVGINEWIVLDFGHSVSSGTMAALGFETLFGALTVTGSVMAWGKLQEVLPGRPIVWPFQNFINLAMLAGTFGLFGWLIYDPTNAVAFWVMLGLSFALGILMVLPIGGADMPVVVSLLNSYAGLAASATGFAIGNNVLIICGALNGASGLLLSILMSKAMNRSLSNVLFGAFGGAVASNAAGTAGLTVRSTTAEDVAVQLAYASSVIIIPGYGLAVAQAQHVVRELGELIEKKGGEVKYAIHPVAGRMPGHMNVILAEANVPYDRLYDMDEINDQFEQCDVAIVVGANDVVNPAARSDPGSPIFGMPILNADKARSILVLKRSMNAGFAGIENELFYDPKAAMLFGDAKASLTKLVAEIKAL